jgi:hypothetical protein
MEDFAEAMFQKRGAAGQSLDNVTLPETDSRVVAAWRRWLEALGTDAEAALAASMAYRQLDGPGRSRWLAAVKQEVDRLSVPRIAVYAPLLAVENDPGRRACIVRSLGPADAAATPRSSARGLCGQLKGGLRVAAIVTPLYLDFAQVLACGYRPGEGIEWVRHDPIVDRRCTPVAGDDIGGVIVEGVPLKVLVDELAHAVVAHSRSGRPLPDALRAFADLFGGQCPAESCGAASGG